ncbi:MAG: response regulator transcription factor [Ignavibacteria bacterium]|nr:response regulator transcription factor [Ignavibacteria bacterium]
MSNEHSIRVAIIEDESVLRKGLAKRITADSRFVCTDVYSSAEALLAADFSLDTIDVFLIDIGLPGISGITLIERLRALSVPGQMLMLTNFDDDANVRSAIMAGARGYLLKTTPPARLLDALEEIYVGGAPMNGSVARIIMNYLSDLPKPSALAILTDRERDVLAQLAERKQYKEIADELFMSIDTVRTHVRNIYSKLNVHRRSEAEVIFREG